jgi:hypothetical protein
MAFCSAGTYSSLQPNGEVVVVVTGQGCERKIMIKQHNGETKKTMFYKKLDTYGRKTGESFRGTYF